MVVCLEEFPQYRVKEESVGTNMKKIHPKEEPSYVTDT